MNSLKCKPLRKIRWTRLLPGLFSPIPAILLPIYASIPYFASRFHNSTHRVDERQPAWLIVFPFCQEGEAHSHTLYHLHICQLCHLNFSPARDKVVPKKVLRETNYRAKSDAFQIPFTYSVTCISYGWIYCGKWNEIDCHKVFYGEVARFFIWITKYQYK